MSKDETYPENNGAVLTISQTIKAVMSSTAEAELGELYINCRKFIPARQLLEDLGHKQPPTSMKTYNTTTLGVANNNIQPTRTNAMDMKFHWIRFRTRQKQFHT